MLELNYTSELKQLGCGQQRDCFWSSQITTKCSVSTASAVVATSKQTAQTPGPSMVLASPLAPTQSVSATVLVTPASTLLTAPQQLIPSGSTS